MEGQIPRGILLPFFCLIGGAGLKDTHLASKASGNAPVFVDLCQLVQLMCTRSRPLCLLPDFLLDVCLLRIPAQSRLLMIFSK